LRFICISSPGSVVATVEMLFGRSACEPLKPLQDELASAKLGQYTVDRQLYVLPPVITPTTTSLNSSSTVLTSAGIIGHKMLGSISHPQNVS